MSAVDDVVASLKPAISDLAEYLEITQQPQALAFFQGVQRHLEAVREEDDLLELFMILSTTAFQGFTLDPFAAMMADRVLAEAQQVAHAFSADDDQVH